MQGYGKPSVIHATVVIFLEFFAWGLLTSPTIQVNIVDYVRSAQAIHTHNHIYF